MASVSGAIAIAAQESAGSAILPSEFKGSAMVRLQEYRETLRRERALLDLAIVFGVFMAIARPTQALLAKVKISMASSVLPTVRPEPLFPGTTLVDSPDSLMATLVPPALLTQTVAFR